MLDGSFHGLTEAQILVRLLARPRPEDTDGAEADIDIDSDAGTVGTVDQERGGEPPDTNPSDTNPSDTNPSDTNPSEPGLSGTTATDADESEIDSTGAAATGQPGPVPAHADEEPANEVSAGGESAGEEIVGEVGGEESTGGTSSGESPADQVRTDEDRWRDERISIREGIELRVGLATLLGCDQRPGEIPGLGPVDAHLARATVARQRRGAEWQFAVVGSDGYLLLAGPLRRRPRRDRSGAGPPGRVRGGVVELHLTLAELYRFAADPDLTGDWAGLVAEVAGRWADRHRLWRELSKDPRARFARGPLARHVRVRDRTCVGPCCDRSARRCDLDHTLDHVRGGDTVEANIGPGCWRHHADKERGWRLTQPRPGQFVWISPLGRTYRSRGEPVRPDLPEPAPPPQGTDRRQDPDSEHGYRLDQRILWREGRDPAPPPPPAPDTEEETPF